MDVLHLILLVGGAAAQLLVLYQFLADTFWAPTWRRHAPGALDVLVIVVMLSGLAALWFLSWRMGRRGRPGLGCLLILPGMPAWLISLLVLSMTFAPSLWRHH